VRNDYAPRLKLFHGPSTHEQIQSMMNLGSLRRAVNDRSELDLGGNGGSDHRRLRSDAQTEISPIAIDVPHIPGDGAMTDIDTPDRCSLDELLDEGERVVLHTVREFMTTEPALKVSSSDERRTIPRDVEPRLRGLWRATNACHRYRIGRGRSLLDGLINMEIARADASTAIFNNTHCGLAMRSIGLFGSDEQRARFLPGMTVYDASGSFAMPATGSHAPMGGTLGLVAERVGNDVWLLNGEARCVGGVQPAAVRIVWAWDRAGRVLNAFVVHEGLDGILGATFDNVEVLEENRLPRATRWSDACQVIDANWVAIEWMAIGCASGAYDEALRHWCDTEFSRCDTINRAMNRDSLTAMGANISGAISRCRRMSASLEKGTTTGWQSGTANTESLRWMKQTVELGARVVGAANPRASDDIHKFTADSDRIASYAASLAVDARRGRANRARRHRWMHYVT
jgi:glutaryl-CoA dehydrogenase